MSKRQHLTAPDPKETGWPKGIPYIIGNEGCERFSFYGMRAILWLYIVSLYQGVGMENAKDEATATYHFFVAGVYALPMIGAILSDRLLGKYKTILWLSMVYTLGHLVLSATEGTIWGLNLGLALIAVGSGGIKPCVSAHVGDQFGAGNWSKLERVYQGFYFIINFGSFFSTLLVPLFREWWGISVAFAVPGVLMAIATLFFWLGRNVFIHVPAQPGGKLGLLDTLAGSALFMVVGSLFFTGSQPASMKLVVAVAFLVIGLVLFGMRQRIAEDDGALAVTIFSLKAMFKGEDKREEGIPSFFGAAAKHFGREAAEGTVAVFKIISIFLLVSVFWALFDQHSSTWIRQAEMMNREFTLPIVGSFSLTPDQLPAMNPLMVMLIIPILTYGVFPLIHKMGLEVTPLRKMSAGMVVTSLSFAAVAIMQGWIDSSGEGTISALWQVIPYVLITTAEVLVSVTGLEFAYSQAPKRMKSTIMGFWLLTVALGNVLVAVIAGLGDLPLESFFWLFAVMMLVAGLLFALRAKFYVTREFAQ